MHLEPGLSNEAKNGELSHFVIIVAVCNSWLNLYEDKVTAWLVDSESRVLGSSPGWGRCAVFLPTVPLSTQKSKWVSAN